ncbi:hypothetical protein AAU61_04615 [Desulfocarbo indianensis]|nr:hypothetical protein AAU61_04615 [Desulfocarbo indianensis]
MPTAKQEACPELWEENRRLRCLVELGKVLADPRQSLEGKLDQCVGALAGLVQAEGCSLMLLEDDRLTVRAANHPELVGLATPLCEPSIATQVAASGRAVYCREVEASDLAGVRRERGLRNYRTGSLISLPLRAEDKVVGVLNLADKAGEPHFCREDLATAQGVAREISRLVHFSALHARLEKAHRELSEAQRAKDDLLHMIVHDMKAPIAGVKEVLGFLEDPAGLASGEREQYLAAARSDLEMLWRRISNFLDLKRMDAGQYPLNLMDLNLAALARESAARLAPLARFYGVALETRAEAEPWVSADEDLLERLITNLLLNALKHSSPEQGGGGRVGLRVGADHGRASLRVADSGPGVEPSLGPHLFQRFVTGKGTAGSTGLGLYFCRRAAALLGGEVGYANQDGGAVFHLLLPQAERA